jgi:hypothetical protein
MSETRAIRESKSHGAESTKAGRSIFLHLGQLATDNGHLRTCRPRSHGDAYSQLRPVVFLLLGLVDG